MKLSLLTHSESGHVVTLGSVEWPAIPCRGDYVRLDGLVAHEHLGKPEDEQPQEEVLFVVERVQFAADVKHPLDPPVIEVHLVLPPESRAWDGAQ